MTDVSKIAVVVIGRNEGERLTACLAAVQRRVSRIVYVDSGSSDGSVVRAESLGAVVIPLTHGPFTAARGRQAGLEEATRRWPSVELVQFIDGDCLLDDQFLPAALAYLESHPAAAAVCARRREERYAESLYSRLIDIDWDIPPGPVPYIGGDALVRVKAIEEAGGWPVDLIAGEEPDLCFRMARRGWRIERLPVEITRHDVRMTRFAEYWRRAVRSGHAYVEVGLRNRTGPGSDWLRMSGSIVFYGAVAPVLAVAGGWFFWPIGVAVALLYVRLVYALVRSCRRRGYPLGLSLTYAACNTLCKVAGAIGVGKYFVGRMTGKRAPLIEYRTGVGAPVLSAVVNKEPCA